MNQRFDGPVEQVAAGDIINQNVEPHGRRLVQAERTAINDMVRQLEDEFGDSGKTTWRWLHGILGVPNIEAMCLGHLTPATELMRLRLELAGAETRLKQFDQIEIEVDAHLNDKEKLAQDLKNARGKLAATIRRAGLEAEKFQNRITALEPVAASAERAEKMLEIARKRLLEAEASTEVLRRQKRIMAIAVLVLLIVSGGLAGLIATSTSAVAQETYRCTINGAKVFQDRPCPGAVRRSDAMPDPDAAKNKVTPPPKEDDLKAQREKLEQDKKYIDERVQARNLEREKDNAQSAINRCNAQAAAILERISAIAERSPQGAPVDVGSALTLQLDQQRRQTNIQSLQAQHSAKVAQCTQLRDSFKEKFGP